MFAGPPHFHAMKVPVRVELWFFFIAVLMGINRDWLPVWYVFEWIAVVFVAILVHELGHAMAFRRYAQEPKVMLYGMGGLTYGSAPFRSRREDIITSFAGPAAGFLLLGVPAKIVHDLLGFDAPLLLQVTVYDLYFVSFIWSLVNLIPVLPLDGGHIAQALWGRPMARRISVVAALVTVLWLFDSGYRYGWFLFLLLGGLAAYEIWGESRPDANQRVAVLPPSPGQYGGGYGSGDYDSPPPRQRPSKPARRPPARGRSRRAHLEAVPDLLPGAAASAASSDAGNEQAESVGWRAVRAGDLPLAKRALGKANNVRSLDPFLAPCVAALEGDEQAAVDGFIAAYLARPEGPSGLTTASIIGEHSLATRVAEGLLASDKPAAGFAAWTLQGHLHFAEKYVPSATVGELLHADPRANRAQVAFEVACAWSQVDRPDLAVAWVGRAIDDGFDAGTTLDTQADLEAARADPAWAAVRARLGPAPQ